jgi:hypothetical protein
MMGSERVVNALSCSTTEECLKGVTNIKKILRHARKKVFGQRTEPRNSQILSRNPTKDSGVRSF